MGHIFKILYGVDAGKGMHCFSSDLLVGCLAFARMAESAEDLDQVLHANTVAITKARSARGRNRA
jgi:hypothetical protein